MIIGQSQIQIIDTTDPITLQSRLSSNLPKVQFLNDGGNYNPNYENSPVIIEPSLYIVQQNQDIDVATSDKVKAIRWYFKLGSENTWTEIESSNNNFEFEILNGKNIKLKIIKNLMTYNNPQVAIRCEIDYQERYMEQPFTQKVDVDFSLSVQGNDGKDSVVVIMSNENHTIMCDSNGTPKDGEIGDNSRAKTDFTVFMGTKELSPSGIESPSENMFFVREKNVPEGISVIKKSDNKTFYINGSSVPESGTIIFEITVNGLTSKIEKALSFNKTKDGQSGDSAYIAVLSNDFHSVPTDENGLNGNYTGCETEINLYEGKNKVTENISYSVENEVAVVGELVENRYIITDLTEDVGTVDLVATYNEVKYIKRFTASKLKKGHSGSEATSYWMITSTSALISPAKLVSEKPTEGMEFLKDSFIAEEGQTGFFIPEITDKDDLQIYINNLNLVENINYTRVGTTIKVPPLRQGDIVKWNVTKLYNVVSTYSKEVNSRTVIDFTPSQVNLEGKCQTGTGEPRNYAARFKIEETIDNVDWIVKYTSKSDEVKTTFVPSPNIKAIKCTMYKAGNLNDKLDEQVIPVLHDGADGENALAIDITGGQIFKYDDSNNVSPNSITLTATGKNFEASNENIQWQCFKNNIWVDLNKGLNTTITPNDNNWENEHLKIKAYFIDRPSIFDEFTLFKVKDGKNTMVSYIHAPNGTVIKNHNKKSLDLQGNIFWGGIDKSTLSTAEYKWEKQESNGNWTVLRDFTSGETGRNIIINEADIPNMLVVKCSFRYEGQVQMDTVVLIDQLDPHQVSISSTSGYSFKNGLIDTHLIANVHRNGVELDVVNLYNVLPPTDAFQNGDIIYITSDDKYRELVNGEWQITETPSVENGKSDYNYIWYKLGGMVQTRSGEIKEAQNYFGNGKIIRVGNNDVKNVATFRVEVKDKY
ncbi:MAG: hypothetical protein KHZ90_09875 [Veillonella parvula]|uniref:Uncharacterized protein n=1 Tax=Veillonella parvula TaxID=29466 RepID=A0A942WW40_VEIPA|nr:hypothetical protein [Veillonella parvula]MBS4894064.1 hypothetical protein [Veillonella parvula]